MTISVLDPTHETVSKGCELAPRLVSLRGKVVGVISNGKKGTAPLFEHLQELLCKKHSVLRVDLLVKRNYSAPAEDEILQQVADWDVAITGVGD